MGVVSLLHNNRRDRLVEALWFPGLVGSIGTMGIKHLIELRARTGFSFLDGTTTPEALVQRAGELGHSTLGIADCADLGGVSRFALACKEQGIRPIVGVEIPTSMGPVALFARNREGYSNLARLVSFCRTNESQRLFMPAPEVIVDYLGGVYLLTGGAGGPLGGMLASRQEKEAKRLIGMWREASDDHIAVELQRHHLGRSESLRNGLMAQFAGDQGLRIVAAHEPRYLDSTGRVVHDVLTALRAGLTVDEAARRGILRPNGEWRLDSPDALGARWSDLSESLVSAEHIADQCNFDLQWLSPPLPRFADGPFGSEDSALRERVMEGAQDRWGSIASHQRDQIEHELRTIARLGFSGYFLCIWDIVRFARERGILCQGRGSAANSAVAYCLGITAVDPIQNGLLFERFLSEARIGERNEAPDIDVDFEHARREEVFDYIYGRYGRNHAAIACMIQTYHAPSGIQDCLRAFGYPVALSNELSKRVRHLSPSDGVKALREGLASRSGLDIDSPRGRAVLSVLGALDDLPRTRSTHPGGFVISSEPLSDYIAIEKTAAGRTILQFDKDDLDDAGIPKFDILGLAALSAVRLSFDAIRAENGPSLSLHTLPTADADTFDLIRSGNTVGIFQIESRAQVASILRTQPETLYDLVVQLALIRPGPIQADFVQPYTRRRRGLEEPTYLDEALRPILSRTMGIPIFQEQAMRISMELGGFTATEADALRRAMGHQKKLDRLRKSLSHLRDAMLKRGINAEAANKIASDLEGFANYGFPESHAWSFGLLSYASAYLKANHPLEFYLGILNSWPMGFYPASTVVNEARRRGVSILPPCLANGDWDCTIERVQGASDSALRIGWRHIKGLHEDTCDRLRDARRRGAFTSIDDVVRRARLSSSEAALLSRCGAFEAFQPGRRHAAWTALGAAGDGLPLAPGRNRRISLDELSEAELILADYLATGISVRGHPLQELRARLNAMGVVSSTGIANESAHSKVRTAGLVVVRQHPQTAGGTVFLLLEDEGGFANIIVPEKTFRQFKDIVSYSPLLLVEGRIQKDGPSTNILATGFNRLEIGNLSTHSRDFR